MKRKKKLAIKWRAKGIREENDKVLFSMRMNGFELFLIAIF